MSASMSRAEIPRRVSAEELAAVGPLGSQSHGNPVAGSDHIVADVREAAPDGECLP